MKHKFHTSSPSSASGQIVTLLSKSDTAWHVKDIAIALDKSLATVSQWFVRKSNLEKFPQIVKTGPATYKWQPNSVDSSPDETTSTVSPVTKPRTPREPRSRIRWSETDNHLIVRELVDRWKKHPEEGITVRNINKAMHKVVDQKYWRKITSLQQVPTIERLARQELHKIVDAGLNPTEVVKTIEVPQDVDIDQILAAVPISRLFMELGTRFETTQNANLQLLRELNNRRDIVTTPVQIPTPPPIPTRDLRIWLVGPLNDHMNQLRTRLQNMPVQIIGMSDKDKSPGSQPVPASMDYYILDTKFISHSWQEHVESRVPKEKIIRKRGIHEIREWLLDLAMKRMKETSSL